MPEPLKTANPALPQKTFQGFPLTLDEAMTFHGTLYKTGVLLLCAFSAAAYAWSQFMENESLAAVLPLFLIGTIGGLIFAILTMVKREWSLFTAPIYAVCEGLFLGSFSAIFELRFPGVAIRAVALTFGVMFVMLFAYSLGLIPVTKKLRIAVVGATGAFVLFYAAGFFLSFFGINFASLNGSGGFSLGLSLVVVLVAALNFILDFDFIARGARAGAPKYMEWYSAFGLIVTLVWLYLEIVRLLTKLRSRE
jgi:uncharacterized YccA/Bax inhibitor family protein